MRQVSLLFSIVFFFAALALAQSDSTFIRENYQKAEYQIPMRDGVKLFTIVYTPKDAAPNKTYPILMQRTCYSVAPYGPSAYPNELGPSPIMMREKYIFCLSRCARAIHVRREMDKCYTAYS